MVLASAGRYLRETLTNIICIFSQKPFHLRHFLWHTDYPKYIDPSRLMTRVFSLGVQRTPERFTDKSWLKHQARRGKIYTLCRSGIPTPTHPSPVACKPSKLCARAGHWQQPPPLPRWGAGFCRGSGHSAQSRSRQLPSSLLAIYAARPHPTPSPEANLCFWLQSIVQGCGRKQMVWSHFTQEEHARLQWEPQCPAERSMMVQ